MEIGGATAVIGIISVALFALPFALDYRRRSRKRSEQLSALQALALGKQCAIHQHEACGDDVLGLDTQRKMLFHLSEREGRTSTQVVPLAHVHTCQVARTERGRKGAHEENSIDRIELSFTSKVKSWPGASILLFNTSYGTPLNGELQFAERWVGLVNGMLKG